MSDWDRKLSEWAAVGLVSTEQAAAIRSHEAAVAELAATETESQVSPVSPAVEAVGYLGRRSRRRSGDVVPRHTEGWVIVLRAEDGAQPWVVVTTGREGRDASMAWYVAGNPTYTVQRSGLGAG